MWNFFHEDLIILMECSRPVPKSSSEDGHWLISINIFTIGSFGGI